DRPHTERFHQCRVFRVPVTGATLIEQVDAFTRAVRRQIETAEYDFVHLRSIWGMSPICRRKQELGYRVVLELTSSPLFDLASRGAPPPLLEGSVRNRLRDEEDEALKGADLLLA